MALSLAFGMARFTLAVRGYTPVRCVAARGDAFFTSPWAPRFSDLLEQKLPLFFDITALLVLGLTVSATHLLAVTQKDDDLPASESDLVIQLA